MVNKRGNQSETKREIEIKDGLGTEVKRDFFFFLGGGGGGVARPLCIFARVYMHMQNLEKLGEREFLTPSPVYYNCLRHIFYKMFSLKAVWELVHHATSTLRRACSIPSVFATIWPAIESVRRPVYVLVCLCNVRYEP